jgi:excisionase family DNA binding protein
MSNTKTPRHEWLGYDEAPTYLGASRRQLQRWTQQKRIEHTRLGNATLFSREQLDRFVQASTVPSEAVTR